MTTAARDALHGLLDGPPTDITAHLLTLQRHASTAQRVVELGVRGGNSTTALLAGVEVSGGRVWSVDKAPHTVPHAIADHPAWTFHQGDTTDPATLVACPYYQAFRPVDVLLIDTSHEHEQTVVELGMYGPLVRDGGLILMHDADLDGVIVPASRWALRNGYQLRVEPRDHGLVIITVNLEAKP